MKIWICFKFEEWPFHGEEKTIKIIFGAKDQAKTWVKYANEKELTNSRITYDWEEWYVR